MTSEVLDVASVEATVASMVGKAYSGATAEHAAVEEEPTAHFEFSDDFQEKLVGHVVCDQTFMGKVGHLVKPEYFENMGHQGIVKLSIDYFRKYRQVPMTQPIVNQLLVEAARNKTLNSEMMREAVAFYKGLFRNESGDLKSPDISSESYMAESVAEFAKRQAMASTILKSVDWLEKGDFDRIEREVKAAVAVGLNEGGDGYDYYESVKQRSETRRDVISGVKKPTGITTGIAEIDAILYHKGWGRKELSIMLGGPKSGKTTAMINFAKSASLAGYNVLYVTLEVSAPIIAERLDASLADIAVKELGMRLGEVEDRVLAAQKRAGALKLHEYPSGTCTPNMVRQLIQRYKSPSMKADGTVSEPIIFDMVVVDYADIMAPNYRTNDTIENSKSVYLDLRAIAQEENLAMLSATQSNREGVKSTTIKAENVADDYNKVRTVDIMISINATDEERANREARLYMAASRNQEGGYTIFINQDLSRMQFIKKVLRIE